jgi:beta-barrel assembly-enhancing protease
MRFTLPRQLHSIILCIGFSSAFAMWACTSSQKKSEEEAAAKARLSPEEQKKLDEMAAEIDLGRNMAGRLLAHYGALDNEGLTGYINQVGNYVASYGDHPERRYMFAVLDTEMVNAFACPGGYILVTLGALRNARNEAELAAVLGHESAHVGLQHMYQTLKKMDSKELDAVAKVADKKTANDENFKARSRPDPSEKSETAEMLARYLSGATGVSVLQAAKAGMSLILEKGLDHEMEFEADREGVKYAINAGYSPKGMVEFLTRLQKNKAKANTKILESTHPSLNDRLMQVNNLLVKMNVQDTAGSLGEARFNKVFEQLPALKEKPAKVSINLQGGAESSKN